MRRNGPKKHDGRDEQIRIRLRVLSFFLKIIALNSFYSSSSFLPSHSQSLIFKWITSFRVRHDQLSYLISHSLPVLTSFRDDCRLKTRREFAHSSWIIDHANLSYMQFHMTLEHGRSEWDDGEWQPLSFPSPFCGRQGRNWWSCCHCRCGGTWLWRMCQHDILNRESKEPHGSGYDFDSDTSIDIVLCLTSPCMTF
jgi:hypothetical protein